MREGQGEKERCGGAGTDDSRRERVTHGSFSGAARSSIAASALESRAFRNGISKPTHRGEGEPRVDASREAADDAVARDRAAVAQLVSLVFKFTVKDAMKKDIHNSNGEMGMKKTGPQESRSPSQLIDARIEDLSD